MWAGFVQVMPYDEFLQGIQPRLLAAHRCAALLAESWQREGWRALACGLRH